MMLKDFSWSKMLSVMSEMHGMEIRPKVKALFSRITAIADRNEKKRDREFFSVNWQ